MVGGPPQALVYVPQFAGLRTLAHSLASPAARRAGVIQGAALALGVALVFTLAVSAVRARHWALMAAAAGLLVLPILLRPQQYGYPKYHVLMPVAVALLVAHWRPGWTALVPTLLLAVNGVGVGADIARGRRLYAEIVPVYERADHRACWLAGGFTPPIPYKWPGTTAGVLATLATVGPERSQQHSEIDADARLVEALEQCFCQASVVVTGDVTYTWLPSFRDLAAHFGLRGRDFELIVWRPGDGPVWLDGRESRVVSYSEERRSAIWRSVRTLGRVDKSLQLRPRWR